MTSKTRKNSKLFQNSTHIYETKSKAVLISEINRECLRIKDELEEEKLVQQTFISQSVKFDEENFIKHEKEINFELKLPEDGDQIEMNENSSKLIETNSENCQKDVYKGLEDLSDKQECMEKEILKNHEFMEKRKKSLKLKHSKNENKNINGNFSKPAQKSQKSEKNHVNSSQTSNIKNFKNDSENIKENKINRNEYSSEMRKRNIKDLQTGLKTDGKKIKLSINKGAETLYSIKSDYSIKKKYKSGTNDDDRKHKSTNRFENHKKTIEKLENFSNFKSSAKSLNESKEKDLKSLQSTSIQLESISKSSSKNLKQSESPIASAKIFQKYKISSKDLQNSDFSCPTCSATFSTKSKFKRHISIHTDPLTCPTCLKKFKLRKNFNSHKCAFECNVCNKKFFRHDNLTQHITFVHGKFSENELFTCDCCGKAFKYKKSLVCHMKQHMEEKPFVCRICNDGFSVKNTFRQHMLTHGGKIPCKICGKNLKPSAIYYHMKQAHETERPFSCPICSATFKTKSDLGNHVACHDKKFGCDICGKKFSKGYKLKQHLNIHENPNINKCEKCLKSFSRKDSLKLHFKRCTGLIERRGTKEKGKHKSINAKNIKKFKDQESKFFGLKFSCDFCGENFNKKNSLRQHITCKCKKKYEN